MASKLFNFTESLSTVLPKPVNTKENKKYYKLTEALNKSASSDKMAGYPVFVIDVIGTKYPTRNNNIYKNESFIEFAKDEFGVWSGIRSAVHKDGIPLLFNHNQHNGTPVGRVIKTEWLEDSKKSGILRMHFAVLDEEVAEGLRSGKYADVSIGGQSDTVKCSICGENPLMCTHYTGFFYDKEGNVYPEKPDDKKIKVKKAQSIMGKVWLHEVSIVNVPGYAHTKIVGEEGFDKPSLGIVNNYSINGNSISEYSIKETASIGENFDSNNEAIKENKQMSSFEESVNVSDNESIKKITEGATSFSDLPLSSKEKEWDSSNAQDRVKKWAGGPDKEKINWSKYSKAFLWFDSEDKENFGAYKLPFADVVSNTLKAVPNGIYAAAAAIQGARGGVDIPSGDMSKIRTHIRKYYDKLDETPPWEEEEDESTESQKTNDSDTEEESEEEGIEETKEDTKEETKEDISDESDNFIHESIEDKGKDRSEEVKDEITYSMIFFQNMNKKKFGAIMENLYDYVSIKEFDKIIKVIEASIYKSTNDIKETINIISKTFITEMKAASDNMTNPISSEENVDVDDIPRIKNEGINMLKSSENEKDNKTKNKSTKNIEEKKTRSKWVNIGNNIINLD